MFTYIFWSFFNLRTLVALGGVGAENMSSFGEFIELDLYSSFVNMSAASIGLEMKNGVITVSIQVIRLTYYPFGWC